MIFWMLQMCEKCRNTEIQKYRCLIWNCKRPKQTRETGPKNKAAFEKHQMTLVFANPPVWQLALWFLRIVFKSGIFRKFFIQDPKALSMGPILHFISDRHHQHQPQHLAKAKVSFLLQFLSLCKSLFWVGWKVRCEVECASKTHFLLGNVEYWYDTYSIFNKEYV